jgi:DNA end-binding protein Ku
MAVDLGGKLALNVEVGIYAATENGGVSFKNLCPCGSKISLQNFCPECDKVIPYSELKKGYEWDKNTMLVFDKDELADAKSESSDYLVISKFVDLKEVDPVVYDSHYYLAPVKPKQEGLFNTLLSAMERSGKAAIARYCIRQREHVGLIRVAHGTMILHTILYDKEVREPEYKADLSTVSPKAVKDAITWIQSLTGNFNHGDYTDEYSDRVMRKVEAKQAGKVMPNVCKASPARVENDDPDSIFGALRADVQGGTARAAEPQAPKKQRK